MAIGGLREDSAPVVPLNTREPVADALRVKFPSELVYDISGRGFTSFEGIPFFEDKPLIQGEGVSGRFFVFDQQPSLDRLAPPTSEPPVAPLPAPKTAAEAVDRVYWYLLDRAPSPVERQTGITALRGPVTPSAARAASLSAASATGSNAANAASPSAPHTADPTAANAANPNAPHTTGPNAANATGPSAPHTADPTAARAATPSAAGLADLLWSVLMSPEFQFIR
jgi:hypothetical protein